MEILTIVLGVLIALIVVILTILIYNQMLLINEVNKRLLLMAKESQENERITMEEFNDRLAGLEEDFSSRSQIRSRREEINPLLDDDDEEPFNPHTHDVDKI